MYFCDTYDTYTCRSPDLVIFVLTNGQTDRQTDRWTEPIALPLAHVCGAIIYMYIETKVLASNKCTRHNYIHETKGSVTINLTSV